MDQLSDHQLAYFILLSDKYRRRLSTKNLFNLTTRNITWKFKEDEDDLSPSDTNLNEYSLSEDEV